MNKLILGLIAVALLTGCGTENSKAKNNEGIETNEETILYTGTVIDFGETLDGGLFLADLTPINSPEVASFDEVILLTEEVSLVDQKSGKPIVLSELVKGDTVQVTLIEHAPTTMSLPPQIGGNGIVKIEKVTDQ